jgi:hypothetical protein
MAAPARIVTTVALAAAVTALAGCRTEYRDSNSDIDDTLWRQVAAIEDPLWGEILGLRSAQDVSGLNAGHWDGAGDASGLHLEDGGAVLYDVGVDGSHLELSVFISSGPWHRDALTEPGFVYSGPSQVFTCFGFRGLIVSTGETWDWDRDIYESCPDELVAVMPDDAAFATDNVFDG